MDTKTFEKSKLPGRHVTEVLARASQRSSSRAKQNLENVKINKNQQVVFPVLRPICLMGSAVGLQGWLAPDGAFVKVARMTKLQHSGPPRAFDCEADGFRSVEKRAYDDGDIPSMRSEHEAPQGGLGMRIERRRVRRAPANPYRSGVLRKHAAQVGPARKGAVHSCR
jgi:dihydroxyacid dehydratase/phosphogluconate dehydratase